MKSWRDMTPDEIRCQFDMRVAVPTGPEFVERYWKRSELVRDRLQSVRDLRYGPGPRQTLDIFPAAQPNAPVLMFWHGGGWRYQSKDHFSYVAEPLVIAGVTTVLVGYDLHPEATLPRMMSEACEAIVWIVNNATTYGADPARITVSGHSAGAQLCGMALAHNFSKYGLPRSPVRGAFLISGSYDMGPHGRHERYLDMGLDNGEFVNEISPAFNPPIDVGIRLIIAVGATETPGYIAQAESFCRKCALRGHEVRLLLSSDDHHFSVVERLSDPEHEMTRTLIELARG